METIATKFIKFLFISIYFVLLFSCASTNDCPKIASDGNLSAPINTNDDDLAPFIFDKELFYTVREDNKYFYNMIGFLKQNKITENSPVNNKMIDKIEQSGLIKLYRNNQINRTYAFFAGLSEITNNNNSSSDIFYTFKNKQDLWVSPINISEINSLGFDSYPAISQDGRTLVFASDREGGFGGIDLYKSTLDEAGIWSAPVNLGNKINTEKDEISPFLNFDNSLLFASKGYSENGDFDIFSARDDGNGSWTELHKLPPPINSNFDDITPTVYNNEIYLSSNKPGGCGGYDIYHYQHCGAVYLEGSITSENPEFPLTGKLYLFDSDRNLLKVFDIDDKGKFRFELIPSNIYYIQYFNSCLPNYIPEQVIVSPCSDTNIVIMKIRFVIPVSSRKFDFANYKVPFFVSGYYQPNTPTSLENLRLKFAYNLLGNDNSTKYIEKPGPLYNDYALVVETALNDAIEHIVRILQNSNDDCMKSNNKFKIKVTGYADPRMLSDFSSFKEESINDIAMDFRINKDDRIDNLLLSKLRAYFTAKYIQTAIKQKVSNVDFNSIKWVIEGLGIDESEKPNEQKRRVNIEIGVSD